MTDASDPPRGDETASPQTRREAGDARRAAEVHESGPALQAHLRAARSELENQVAQAKADFEEANERIKERTGRDLIVATLIGLAIGVALLGSLIFVKWAFVPFALAAALLAMFEFSRALIASGRRVDLVPQLIAGAVVVLSAYFVDAWLHWVLLFVALAFLVVWRLVAQMASHDGRTYATVLGDVLLAAFLQLYVAFLGSLCLVLLSKDGGEWWVLSFIIVAVGVDTGAYVAGITLGKHPMAPRISPKKTWEGFAGAAAAAIIAGVLVGIFMLGLAWWMGAVFGILILATATVGDLGESMIKRDLGIKDMSSWLPGHGGVLDRLDSILLSVVAALTLYYLFTPMVAS
ncbi:phosphatidate cytidylyltransferase [Microbacterium sp. B35-04]|uniref:phosphatidate cytidylyltransferase n=1 Tax=unclassified Microbacterium TaxID=2609290 RepID=UPI0013D76777|nr:MULTISPECIES: phosphatidate cytidylyltransferase [unclassified Microbacterium]KAF2412131.1 phosphatidate cytidylyltransferase [Microbacterium sp. B35-04]KAF2419334.1 phosphatidate cytidylyltransferase [Microbacterium sp. B35-30]